MIRGLAMIPINEHISYFPAIESPLAADTGVIWGDQYLWLFDIGPNAAVLADLLTQEKPICLAFRIIILTGLPCSCSFLTAS